MESASPLPSFTSTPLVKGMKTKIDSVKITHPPYADMVVMAIDVLKERGGSSLQAIKKYIQTNYNVDTVKSAPFIKKFIKNAVENGALIQTKGTGASGSFKLPAAAKRKAGASKKPKATSIDMESKKDKKTSATVKKKKSKKIEEVSSPTKITKKSSKNKTTKPKMVATKKIATTKKKVPTSKASEKATVESEDAAAPKKKSAAAPKKIAGKISSKK